ncbi:MAG: hypothetical protein ABSG41_11725 [Bryobacteraceae bacterium]
MVTLSGVYVPVSVAFPGTLADIDAFLSLLSTLSRTDVVFWCAKINHVLTNASDLNHMQRQAVGVRQFLTPEEAYLIGGFSEEHGGTVTVFLRGALLEIIRWAVLVCEDHTNDGTTFEDPEVRRTFAKVALIANDIWGSRVYGRLSLDGGIAAARDRSIGPFRKGVEAGMVAPQLAHSLGRGWEIFHKLIPATNKFFSERFESAAGLNIEEYYACACTLITNLLKPGSAASIFDSTTVGSNTKNPALLEHFVALESQTLSDLRRALWGDDPVEEILGKDLPVYDYKPLREKPLIRAADGRTIISDPVFMNDKLSVGPLFHALRSCRSDEVQQMFADFGHAVERHAQAILRRAFPMPVAGLFDPLACGLSGTSSRGERFEIDAHLNYVTDLILFEVKGTWLREEEFAPENSPSLLRSLYRQYGASEEGRKGTAQLARLVTMISSGEWFGPEFRQVRRILPVLVVQDLLLGAPGFGSFVAAAFDRALGPCERLASGERLKGTMRVTAPIVITIEDLELLEVSVEHFGFREALVDYSDEYPERMTSFSQFLAISSKYSRQIYGNRHLASASMEALQLAMEQLFSQPAARRGGRSEE